MEEGTGTKSLPTGMNPNQAYATSFGALPDGFKYAGWDGSTENKSRAELNNTLKKGLAEMKAVGTTAGGAGTAGYAMIPIYVDPEIVDRTRKNTPLCEIIPRVTNQGMYADFNVITAKGGAFVAAEDAALAETDTTYDRISTAIKFVYAVGRVTGPAQAATPSAMLAGFQPSGGAVGGFGNSAAQTALQREVLVKARELKEKEESLMTIGDASTTATEFSGITIIQGTTNKVDKNSTALTLEDMNTAIQYAFDDGGRPNLGVCSSAVYTDLLNLLQAKIGYLNSQQTVFWGMQAIVYYSMVGPIPIIPSMYLVNTANLKSIYFLDLSVWEMRVLMDMTYEKLAKTNDSEKFMLKMYECMICRAPTFNSWIGEIA